MSNLNSIKELLFKKAGDDSDLVALLHYIDDDKLADKLLESLEKMARPQASMGRSANAAITAFGNQLKNKDVEMMRDALAHHVNHYRSALQHGKRDIADQHLNKIVPMMHLAARAAAHSGGQLGLDYVPLEPWETNFTSPARFDKNGTYVHPNDGTPMEGKVYKGAPGKLIEGTKGLRRRLNSVSRDKNPRSVPDYRYLEMAPHEEHADSEKSPHKGGYPFEEIQMGNPAKIDAKEAYLHLHDVGPQDAFVPHPFDMHPIHEVAEHKQDSLSPKHMEDFAQKMQGWHGSEHNAKWMEGVKQLHAKDPEAFKTRGKAKAKHHFEGLELLPQPHAKQREQGVVQSQPVETASQLDASKLPPGLDRITSKVATPVAAPAAAGKQSATSTVPEEVIPQELHHILSKLKGNK